jgi:ABC-2 type transport system permease protein
MELAVDARNVVKVYEGKTRALDYVNLQVETGKVFALLIGVKFVPNPLYFAAAIAVIFIASGGFAAISVLIAAMMKSRERFMGIGQAIIMPLFFASNALYPVEIMPPVLRELSLVNPLSYVVDAVRSLMITGDISRLPVDLLVIATFDIVMFIVASISFKRIIE